MVSKRDISFYFLMTFFLVLLVKVFYHFWKKEPENQADRTEIKRLSKSVESARNAKTTQLPGNVPSNQSYEEIRSEISSSYHRKISGGKSRALTKSRNYDRRHSVAYGLHPGRLDVPCRPIKLFGKGSVSSSCISRV